ncbi:hypothetical protein ZYGR_0AD01240 [Zygosaccharomyces rouxii]|uniref:ZYRO0G08756p n=2 Tax=Zygosaccharomyces rouxii TaxID=4956 RepID=C5E008_ZYGRC|nr:uncharacterized protein ZYRO0G08756g [Zygosaccharomyces rouxii]KAH9202436.1 hypothetical protein LQ764DRAFT_25491 [Zygosaccharomyces rouxii]GAV50941.1 hypothetical protein ZYGR_0AD01240 [Zygosaccharomyces rouxii]CAR29442.1 ZYRO0G08756p [Zygosaccharomyces rouxii]
MGIPMDLYRQSCKRRYLDCPQIVKDRLWNDMRRSTNTAHSLSSYPLGWKMCFRRRIHVNAPQFFYSCNELCWIGVNGTRLTIYHGESRGDLELPDAQVRCVGCHQLDDSTIYVYVGTSRGVFRGILNGDSFTCPIWKVIPMGGCLALDASDAPSHLVALMENDGVVISCSEGVFRLKEPVINNGNESYPAVDVSRNQLAISTWQERFDTNKNFDATPLLFPDESVLHVKCMNDSGILLHTNQRLVVIQPNQLQPITTNGCTCFHYDGHHIYTVEQHLYGTCFTIYEMDGIEDKWCQVGYYDIRATFGISKVLGMNVSGSTVELLSERNQLYRFEIQYT